jgi:hypothetical protein
MIVLLRKRRPCARRKVNALTFFAHLRHVFDCNARVATHEVIENLSDGLKCSDILAKTPVLVVPMTFQKGRT